MLENKILFSLTSSKDLAKEIARIANIELGESEVVKFSDGEIMARCLSNVLGKTCYIVQSTIAPSTETIFEIVVFVDSLKNAGAKEVVLVTPYYGYSRQDRVARSGEPITAKVVAEILENTGISRVISVDLHTQQIQGFFSIPVINIDTSVLFGKHFAKRFDELGICHKDVTVVSPDHGSANRGRDVCSELNGAKLAVIDKRRPAPNESEVTDVVGEVNGKVCLIIDDIIDTCGTINNAVQALFDKGAKEIYVGVTHAVVSHGEIDSRVKEFVVTDTIKKENINAEVISVAELIAETL